MEMEMSRPKAANLCQLDDGRLMVVGHRGCRMNVVDYSPDSRSSDTFRENTVASFKAAAASAAAHLHFLEFDVQVTKDDCPVIFHDNFILTQAQGAVVEKRITELTLDEFLSYGPQKQPGKEGKPLFRKTKNGRVVKWKVEKDDALCKLEEVFENAGQTVGFDIELKLDDAIVYEEEEMRHVIKVVMDVVQKYAKKRVVIFSSFHPDATRLMRQMQDTYPVMFITKGGTEIFKDPRKNSLEEAIKHCRYAGLHGIVSEVNGC